MNELFCLSYVGDKSILGKEIKFLSLTEDIDFKKIDNIYSFGATFVRISNEDEFKNKIETLCYSREMKFIIQDDQYYIGINIRNIEKELKTVKSYLAQSFYEISCDNDKLVDTILKDEEEFIEKIKSLVHFSNNLILNIQDYYLQCIINEKTYSIISIKDFLYDLYGKFFLKKDSEKEKNNLIIFKVDKIYKII